MKRNIKLKGLPELYIRNHFRFTESYDVHAKTLDITYNTLRVNDETNIIRNIPIKEPQYTSKKTGRKRKGIVLKYDPRKVIWFLEVYDSSDKSEFIAVIPPEHYKEPNKLFVTRKSYDDRVSYKQDIPNDILNTIRATGRQLIEKFNELRVKTLFFSNRAQRNKRGKLRMEWFNNPVAVFYNDDKTRGNVYIIQRPTMLFGIIIRLSVTVKNNEIKSRGFRIDDDIARASVRIPGYLVTRRDNFGREYSYRKWFGKYRKKARLEARGALRAVRQMHAKNIETTDAYKYLLFAQERLNSIRNALKRVIEQMYSFQGETTIMPVDELTIDNMLYDE